MKLRFQKWDIAIFAGIALVALFVFALFLPKNAETGAYAELYQTGQRIKTVSLSQNQTFTIEGAYCNTVTVADGKIAITDSNCPGMDCVRCGWISGTGRSVVCLPNGLEIRVVAGDSDVDFVVG